MAVAATLANRRLGALVLAAVCVAFGMLLGARPGMAIALAALTALLAMAFVWPVAHLTLLLFVTAIVPYELQNSFGLSGGVGVPGLLVGDVVLLTGLIAAAVVLLREPPAGRRLFAAVAVILFLSVALLQLVQGWQLGRDLSDMGVEFRAMLGFGALLITLPILGRPASRDRLLKVLLALGLVLGAWGLIQWLAGIEEGAAGAFGIREGVQLTTSGRGQLQGGLYLFPLAVTIGFAVLISGRLKTLPARLSVTGLIGLNAICLLLTYERTFWVATVVSCMFVALRGGWVQRLRAFAWGLSLSAVLLASLTAIAPAEVQTAGERFLSLGQYATDDSVRVRARESREVVKLIAERPVTGNGLAALVYWGQPWNNVPTSAHISIESAYLWLAWKLGIPGALLLIALLLAAIAWRGPPLASSDFAAVRHGAQGALVLLMFSSFTWAPFNDVSVTPLIGVLVALCCVGAGSALRASAGASRP